MRENLNKSSEKLSGFDKKINNFSENSSKFSENAQKEGRGQNLSLETTLSARTVWGKLVSKLKELNLITLFTACGEIRDVKFKENTLVVKTKEEFLYNILVKDKNKAQIDFYLHEIDDKINLNLILDNKTIESSKENLKKLTKFFGKDLDIK